MAFVYFNITVISEGKSKMLKKYLLCALVSMVPLIELRAGVPIAVGMGLPYFKALIVCVIANMLPVPVIYFFARRSIWKQIGFLFLYYSGLIGTLAMLKPWLVDLGYDMKEIGVMSGVAGTFVGFLSSFAGGMIVRRIGRFRARILFAVFVLMATLYFLGLSYVHPTTPMLYGGIFLLWGSYGMATIVVYTTAMDSVRPGREGTDFTIQTVITHLSGMLMAILSGRIADHTGYHGLFFFEASIALVSLIYIVTVFRKDKNTI